MADSIKILVIEDEDPTHRRQIMSKLGLYSLPELTKYAIRCGLTSIE